jgi:dTDP-4-amino-4,6-dideoxygalactose transaminase
MKSVTFAPWPSFDREVVDAVRDVLVSGKVANGRGITSMFLRKSMPNIWAWRTRSPWPMGRSRWMSRFVSWVVGPGDEVVVTSRSFVASAGRVTWLRLRLCAVRKRSI